MPSPKDLPIQQTRWYGWRPDKPDIGDEDYLFRPRVTTPPPSTGGLDPALMPKVGNQGNLGSCTGWSASRALMYVARHQGHKSTEELSARFAYYNGRVIEGTIREDAGCEIRDVIKAIDKLGCAPERRCPYSIRNFALKPGPVAYREALRYDLLTYNRIPQVGAARVLAVKQALMAGFPVVFGFSVYADFEGEQAARTGLMRMPAGDVLGGHAVWSWRWDDNKVVYDQRGAFRVRNSWGEWGDAGDFWMPYAYAGNNNLCDDFWALSAVVASG